MEAIYVAHVLMGPLLLLFAFIFRLFPPKKINHYYGYRMPSAMRNQIVWNRANLYAAKVLIYGALLTILIQFIAFLIFKPFTSFLIGAIAVCIAALSVLPFTEKYISNNFDENGDEKVR